MRIRKPHVNACFPYQSDLADERVTLGKFMKHSSTSDKKVLTFREAQVLYFGLLLSILHGRYSRPFNRVCPQSISLWKRTSRSVFRCAGRGSGGHPSKYWPSEKLLDLGVIAWHRTPTTLRTLSVNNHNIKCKDLFTVIENVYTRRCSA